MGASSVRLQDWLGVSALTQRNAVAATGELALYEYVLLNVLPIGGLPLSLLQAVSTVQAAPSVSIFIQIPIIVDRS